MRPRTRTSAAMTLVSAAVLAGCASSPEEVPAPTSVADCAAGDLPTQVDGVLTVATGAPFSPWFVGEADSGEGYESAVVYEVAARLGYDAQDVRWTTVTFDQIVAPGIKEFDVAVYQASISDQRRTAVDFSSPYLTTRQGVLVQEEGPYADATALADLAGARIGVTATQTSLDVARAALGEDAELVPFSYAGDGARALESETIDAMVMDLDQAIASATEYHPDSVVIGALAAVGEPEEYGLVLDLGSPLTTCVSGAVDELRADGTLDRLQSRWLPSRDVSELS